jgi:sulfopyruvate decarboxylase TPP-binding subunit
MTRRRWMVVGIATAAAVLGGAGAALAAGRRRTRELFLGSWIHKAYVRMKLAPYSMPARAVIDQLQRAEIDTVVTVPDFVQFKLHEALERGVPGIRLVRCATEEQAICVAAGLTIGGARPLVVIQNQGLYACVNALRAVVLDAGIPLPLLVGQFGREFDNLGRDPAKSRRRVVRLVEPLAHTMELDTVRLERPGDVSAIADAITRLRTTGRPCALLVGAYLT